MISAILRSTFPLKMIFSSKEPTPFSPVFALLIVQFSARSSPVVQYK